MTANDGAKASPTFDYVWSLVQRYADATRYPINGPDPSGDEARETLQSALRGLVSVANGVMVDAPISERAELLAALTEAHEAIQGAGRKYGEVGTRDCDITDHNTRMDRALLAISSVLNKLAPHVYGVKEDANG